MIKIIFQLLILKTNPQYIREERLLVTLFFELCLFSELL